MNSIDDVTSGNRYKEFKKKVLDILHISSLINKKFEDMQWLVDKIIPTGGLVALSGNPATYKTWIIMHLAAQVAAGEPVFGKLETTQSGVLFIDEESGERLLNERLKILKITNKELPVYFSSLTQFKINKLGIEEIIKESEDKDIKLVIFDSLVRIHKSEENDAVSMAHVFSLMKQLNKNGISVLFTHHHRKGQAGGGYNSSQEMRGSSDILAAVDAHIAIKRKEDYLILEQTKMRYCPEFEPFKLNIIEDDDLMSFEYGDNVQIKQSKKDDIHSAIMDVLEEATEPIYKQEIREKTDKMVKVGYSTFRTTLDKMIEENVVYSKQGEKNKVYCSLKPF